MYLKMGEVSKIDRELGEDLRAVIPHAYPKILTTFPDTSLDKLSTMMLSRVHEITVEQGTEITLEVVQELLIQISNLVQMLMSKEEIDDTLYEEIGKLKTLIWERPEHVEVYRILGTASVDVFGILIEKSQENTDEEQPPEPSYA